MNTALMFSSQSDEWTTPPETFAALDAEFHFEIDLAASSENTKCDSFYSIEHSALDQDWNACFDRGWLNPPYSRGLCAKFIAKAAEQRELDFLTVMLLPVRTDTKAFHAHIWDVNQHRCRAGVEVRFLAGRLKFGGSQNAAPFPSMIVIFRPDVAH